ncbi:hypothetical protein HKX48_003311, partial [Thoreauomyces humboldtii]
ARKVAKPTVYDWSAVKRIFRYLKGTIDFCLHFTRNPDGELEGLRVYADADYA